jgi:hypothetical protein
VIVLGSAALCASHAAPDEPAASIDRFLRERLKLTPGQLEAVARGDAVTVDLPTTVDREIAVGGVVRIRTHAERVMSLLRDVETLESGPGFLGTKRFGNPPVLADLDTLTLPAEDVAALRTCRPGRCDVKLGQGAFDLLKQIDWNAPDAAERVHALARQTALDYVNAYRKGGNEELAIYRDTERPQFIAREFDDMVRQRATQLPTALPGLADYLSQYPHGPRPEGLEEFYYWSLADFGLKPVVRLNHVVIVPYRQPVVRYAIATKQLYASHYFHTALELRAVVADSGANGEASYLVVLNIARSDGLTGMFGGIVRGKVRSGSRQGLQKALAAIKRRAEAS